MATATTRELLKARMGRFFGAHGRFCASHPWEVIATIVTLTVCVLSMGVLNGSRMGICGIHRPCENEPEGEDGADSVLLSIVNSLAVIYVYNQFSSLRKAGSKYLLGIAGLFTIFAGFVFGTGVVNLIDDKVSGLNEALPFFLLLIDLSKASALAKFAFKSRNKAEVLENIGRGMAVLGPNMTLDTLVEVLLISIGTISGVRQLEMICYFGAMSIIANYLVFMTFFPASLALVLEVCPHDLNNPAWQLDELARAMQEEEKKPNPVVQRVKIIMALGLTVVHLHSRFLAGMTGLSFGFESQSEKNDSESEAVKEGTTEKVSIPEYLWWKAFNLSPDQLIMIGLATVLFVKYIFFDKSDTFASSVPTTPAHSQKNSLSYNQSPLTPTSLSCPIRLSATPESALARCQGTSQFHIDLPKFDNPSGSLDQRWRLDGTSDICLETEGNLQPALPGIEQPTSDSSVATLPSLPDDKPTSKLVSISVQTDSAAQQFLVGGSETPSSEEESDEKGPIPEPENGNETLRPPRPLEECLAIFKSESGATTLTDDEILGLVGAKHIPSYKLETAVGDPERGVSIRRKMVLKQITSDLTLDDLPYSSYNYSLVMGACCENVVGYMPVPVGVAGPLLLDGESYYVPMATTEGTLVASTNRGCRAISSSGGVNSYVVNDGMTRGPVVRLPSAAEASSLKLWLENPENFSFVEEAFSSTSRFAKLKSVYSVVAGRLVYIRFKATTGDAMGMNMLSKGVEKALEFVRGKYPNMETISLSGNFCTDKKHAAINWLEGRGKSVVCEATVPSHIVKQVLKTNVSALVDLNISKNLVGSAMAGSIGGFNAHAANVVTAIFIATGQDPAQNIASSNCITLMERSGPTGEDLYISCTMPSIEVGTVGGGTILPPQAACLKLLGLCGSHHENPGEHATKLARVVCGTVLAGELSLLSALAAGHLVKSHLTHNRSQSQLAPIPEAPLQRTPCNRTHSAPTVSPRT